MPPEEANTTSGLNSPAEPASFSKSRALQDQVAGILQGDRKTIASALDQVENARPEELARKRALIGALEQATPESHTVVGLTGPPGAGKSSLAGALVRHWLSQSLGVGMTAVDPSSQRSGGALLGDRMRVRFDAHEPVFVRSMGAADQLGGLAPATRSAAIVLRAAFDWTLIETVGVGQSEIEIQSVADSVVLVLQPGSGDTLQFMKAGILEIPDVLVVHKWDLGAQAERTRADLEAILSLQADASSEWRPAVVGASAHSGHGIDALAAALVAHREWLASSGELARRRRASQVSFGLQLFERRYGTFGLAKIGGSKAARVLATEVPGSGLDVFMALAIRAGLEADLARDPACRAEPCS